MLAYGFLGLDLPEYFQRLSFGWRGDPSFELLVVHLVTSPAILDGQKDSAQGHETKGLIPFTSSVRSNSGSHFLGGQSSVSVRGRGGPGRV